MQTPCVQQSRVQACSDHLGRSGHRLLRSTTAATRCSSRPFASTTRCQARQRSTAAVQQAKQQLASLAGNKYGHNLTAQQKQDIEKVVKQLEDMAPRNKKQPDLTGSDWKLLYTTSSGSSGGKVFPKDQPGIYINKLKLGPVKADLTAKYRYVGSDRIDVNFVDIAAYLGSLRLLHKDFGGRGGYWKLTYYDDDLRILYSGQGNIFVLQRATS